MDTAPNSPSSSQIMAKIISFWDSGKEAQLLDALSQPLAHQAAGANGIKSLKHLEALVRRVGLRIQPRLDPPVLVRL